MEGVEERTEDRAGSVSARPPAPLEHWMSRYQQADPGRAGRADRIARALALLRFFRYNAASA